MIDPSIIGSESILESVGLHNLRTARTSPPYLQLKHYTRLPAL
jgi:hypothetical protein